MIFRSLGAPQTCIKEHKDTIHLRHQMRVYSSSPNLHLRKEMEMCPTKIPIMSRYKKLQIVFCNRTQTFKLV